MAVVPTQLLGFADGGMSQGWSTMYDLKVLNKDLIVAGKIINEEQGISLKTSNEAPIFTKVAA